MKNIAILGSTGSIGKQALDVIARHPNDFRVVALTAHRNSELLYEQVRRFRPELAVLEQKPEEIPSDLFFCRWAFGTEGLTIAATLSGADDVIIAISGFAGLRQTYAAAMADKRVLLANKESLVSGGALFSKTIQKRQLIPIDSEHSAVFQCLQAQPSRRADKIILTASGGPFRDWPRERIETATAADALRHPTWVMGERITIDSASMINKALEIVEAHWLFGLSGESIDVLVHPECLVHSFVKFTDEALLAQISFPDMRIPILYALTYPERMTTGVQELDLTGKTMSFYKPDIERFPGLKLGYEVLRAGGITGAVLNAADEVAVSAFLDGRILFGKIPFVIEEVLSANITGDAYSLSGIEEVDRIAREKAQLVIARMGKTVS